MALAPPAPPVRVDQGAAARPARILANAATALSALKCRVGQLDRSHETVAGFVRIRFCRHGLKSHDFSYHEIKVDKAVADSNSA